MQSLGDLPPFCPNYSHGYLVMTEPEEAQPHTAANLQDGSLAQAFGQWSSKQRR